MIIGLDLDNTIAAYEDALHIISNQFDEIPNHISKTKQEIKNFFKDNKLEERWTYIQGELYGPGMKYAVPYPGFNEFLEKALLKDYQVNIISHRSLKPYGGQNYDLHGIAKDWIKKNIPTQNQNRSFEIYILETLEEKIEMIDTLGCNVFLDDLRKVLNHKKFPKNTAKYLFSQTTTMVDKDITQVQSWAIFSELIGAI